MHSRTARRLSLSLVALLGAAFSSSNLSAQAPTATITGRITDSLTQQPLGGAEVFAAQGAGGRGVRTAANGRYTITGAPVGAVTLRVRALGFAPKEQNVTLTAGQTATFDFGLSTRTTQLDE